MSDGVGLWRLSGWYGAGKGMWRMQGAVEYSQLFSGSQ